MLDDDGTVDPGWDGYDGTDSHIHLDSERLAEIGVGIPRDGAGYDEDDDDVAEHGDRRNLGLVGAGNEGAGPFVREPIPGTGRQPADLDAIRAELEREDHRRSDTGIGNVRRVAAERSTGAGTGGAGTGQPDEDAEKPTDRGLGRRMATSIEQAAERLRAEHSEGLTLVDGPGLEARIKEFVHSEGKGGNFHAKRAYQRSVITSAPKFRECELTEVNLAGLRAAATGEWIVTLKIPPSCFEEVTKLSSAYGLALDMTITRKSYAE